MNIFEVTRLKEAGIVDYAKAMFKPQPGTQGMTMTQRAQASAGADIAKQLGVTLGNQWAQKRAAIAQAAQTSRQPEDKKYIESSLRDLVDRVAFRGRMSQVDPAIKPQVDAAINDILAAGLDPTANKKAWQNLGTVASAATITKNTPAQRTAQATAQPAAPATSAPTTAQPAAPAAAATPVAPDAAQVIANLEKTVPKDVLMAVASELIKKYTSRATPK